MWHAIFSCDVLKNPKSSKMEKGKRLLTKSLSYPITRKVTYLDICVYTYIFYISQFN